jgi:hypothetical protein
VNGMCDRDRRCLVIGLVGVVLVAISGVAVGQETGTGDALTVESLFQAGSEAFDAGQYDSALARFKAAYAREAVPDILYMVGRSYELNRNYREALNTYRKVYKHAGVSKKTSGYAADGIIKLEELFPSQYGLNIAYQPATAVLQIDGIQTGRDGAAKLEKKPGTYAVQLEAEGYRPYQGEVALESSTQLVLRLHEIPPPPKFITPPEPPTDWKRPAGWVAVGFGALAGAAGSVFLMEAQKSADAANAAAVGAAYDSHRESAEFNQTMAFGNYGAAVIGIGLGVVWLITATDAPATTAEAGVTPTGAGVLLRW